MERPINFCIARDDKLVYGHLIVAMTTPASRDATQLRPEDTPMNTSSAVLDVQKKESRTPFHRRFCGADRRRDEKGFV